MFNISDSGRRNTVNLGAFGHIYTHGTNSVLRSLPNKSIKFEISERTHHILYGEKMIWSRASLAGDLQC